MARRLTLGRIIFGFLRPIEYIAYNGEALANPKKRKSKKAQHLFFLLGNAAKLYGNIVPKKNKKVAR